MSLERGENKLEDVLKFELSPIPLSLFDKNGEMRDSKSKSALKKALHVETSCRIQPEADVIILDGCALLWTVSWPIKGTVETLADALYNRIASPQDM